MQRARTAERRAELQAELALPPFPDAIRYLWDAFGRMRRGSGGNGYGPNPLAWVEIQAFVHLGGVRLAPWEVSIIEALDDCWLSSIDASPADDH